MHSVAILVTLLACFAVDNSEGQFYTSSFEIETLLNLERKLLDNLNEYVERQQKHRVDLDPHFLKFLSATKQKNRETNRNHDLDNPLSTFHIVKRWVHQWTELTKNLTCIEKEDVAFGEEQCPILTGADIINNGMKRERARWPSDVDLQLAANAILHFWNVYQLDVSDVARGKLPKVQEQPLSADEIFFIADHAKNTGKLYEAITWFEHLRAHLEEFTSYEFKKSTLFRRLAASYFSYGIPSTGIELLERYLEEDADDKGVSRDLTYFLSNPKDASYKEVTRFKEDDEPLKIQSRQIYEELCRPGYKGDNSVPALSCELLPLYNTYGVVKMELLSQRPRIEMLYDVINETEADNIRKFGEKDFTRFAEMLKYKDGSVDTTSRSGPLCENDKRLKLLLNITRRLEEVTRFMMYPDGKVASSECYTVVNEGLGTVTRPQVLYWPEDHEPYRGAGNRLATIMLQLSNVRYGGNIVFPRIRVSVPVVKGSAVVWWNLKQDGSSDKRSLHINCPVVVGSRWVAYKTILSTNQLFRRPCEK